VHRFAAAVEYNGREFCGWQRQSHSPGVQQAVETALSYVANQPIAIACAGRTDTGVHATNQIIHFDTTVSRQPHNWLLGANTQMPDGVRLHWVQELEAQFHARFSALSRTYRYVIHTANVHSALFKGLVTHSKHHLDVDRMHIAAQGLLGENDFTSYRAAGCQSRTPFRNIKRICVFKQGALVVIEINANAFLHHMVRNIAGVLMAVGRGDRLESWPAELLAMQDRTAGEVTAPPDGLYLVNVEYPEAFGLPFFDLGPLFIQSWQGR